MGRDPPPPASQGQAWVWVSFSYLRCSVCNKCPIAKVSRPWCVCQWWVGWCVRVCTRACTCTHVLLYPNGKGPHRLPIQSHPINEETGCGEGQRARGTDLAASLVSQSSPPFGEQSSHSAHHPITSPGSGEHCSHEGVPAAVSSLPGRKLRFKGLVTGPRSQASGRARAGMQARIGLTPYSKF